MRHFLTTILLLGSLMSLSQNADITSPKHFKQVAISSIDTGWYLGMNYGISVWGDESTCACNTPSFEVNAGYEWSRGVGFGLSLLHTRTIWQLVSIQGDLSYFPSLGGSSNRILGLAVGGGVPVRLENVRFNSGIDNYLGMTRYYEVRVRGRLGKRQDTRVVLAAGLNTISETYRVGNNWDGTIGGTRTTMRHSGIRVRVGIVW